MVAHIGINSEVRPEEVETYCIPAALDQSVQIYAVTEHFPNVPFGEEKARVSLTFSRDAKVLVRKFLVSLGLGMLHRIRREANLSGLKCIKLEDLSLSKLEHLHRRCSDKYVPTTRMHKSQGYWSCRNDEELLSYVSPKALPKQFDEHSMNNETRKELLVALNELKPMVESLVKITQVPWASKPCRPILLVTQRVLWSKLWPYFPEIFHDQLEIPEFLWNICSAWMDKASGDAFSRFFGPVSEENAIPRAWNESITCDELSHLCGVFDRSTIYYDYKPRISKHYLLLLLKQSDRSLVEACNFFLARFYVLVNADTADVTEAMKKITAKQLNAIHLLVEVPREGTTVWPVYDELPSHCSRCDEVHWPKMCPLSKENLIWETKIVMKATMQSISADIWPELYQEAVAYSYEYRDTPKGDIYTTLPLFHFSG